MLRRRAAAMGSRGVFRHNLWVKSRELGQDCTCSLTFTHAQHSGRFSARTPSQQQQILCIIQARGGAARCSRQEVTYKLWCGEHVYSTPTPSLALIATKSLDIFGVCVTNFSSGINVLFVSLTIMNPTTRLRWIQKGLSPAVFTHHILLTFYYILRGQAEKVCRSEALTPTPFQ